MISLTILIGISQKQSMWVNKGQNTKRRNTKADKTIKVDKDTKADQNTTEI